MAGQKGHKKYGGRAKGTPNKLTKELRTMISDFLQENFETIKGDYAKLSPKDRSKLYCDLLQYGLPKLQSTSIDIQGSEGFSPPIIQLVSPKD